MNETSLDMQSKPPLGLPHALSELRHYLQRYAERGVTADSAEQTLVQLSVLAEKAKATGLTAFCQLISNGSNVFAQLLQANYVCLQYEQLLENAGNFGERQQALIFGKKIRA